MEIKVSAYKKNIHVDTVLLALFFILLPVDSAIKCFGLPLIDFIALAYIFCALPHVLYRKNKKLILILFFFIGYAITSMSWSINIFSKSNLMFLIYSVFTLVSFYRIYKLEEKIFLKKSIYLSIILLMVLYIFFMYKDGGRITISIGEKIDENYFTCGLILINGILLNNIKKKNYRKTNFVLLMISFVIIILSGSRGGLLTFVIGITAYLIFSNRISFKKVIFSFLILGLFYLVFMKIMPDKIADRFSIMGSLVDGGSGRVTIWKDMLSFYFDGNFFQRIFGYGRESTSILYYDNIGRYYSPHNIYIKLLVEGGIFGLALLLIMLLYLLIKCLKLSEYLAASMLIALMVSGFFLDMDNTRIFWIILLFAFSSIKNKEVNNKTYVKIKYNNSNI